MTVTSLNHVFTEPEKSRQAIHGNHPSVLADIYQENTNIVIWQRQLENALEAAADKLLQDKPNFKTSLVVTPESAEMAIMNVLNNQPAYASLAQNISQLVTMFCYLFELKNAGLRLTALNDAMCPRFHVDRVPCRLVTTYRGIATQWLPHSLIDRSKLILSAQNKSQQSLGLFSSIDQIENLNEGDVALLKGELWEGNENAGLVHRSPQLAKNNNRLLLTLDFINS